MSTFISLSVNKETGDPETDSDEEEVNKSLVLPTIAITESCEASSSILSSRDHYFPRRHCNCTKCRLSKQQESAEKEQMIVVLRQQLKEQDDTLQEMAGIFKNNLLQANKTLQDRQTRLDNQAETIAAYRGKLDKAEELVAMNANQFDIITDLRDQIASCKNLNNNQKQTIAELEMKKTELTNDLTKMREGGRLNCMLINGQTVANGELKMKNVDLEKKIAELEEDDDEEEEEDDDKPHWACPYCLKTGGFPVITNTSRTCCEDCAMTSDKPPEPTALLPNWALADLLKVKPTIAADVLDKWWIGIPDQKQILSRRQQLRGKPFIAFMKHKEHNWKPHTLVLAFCFLIMFLFFLGSVHKHGLTLRTMDGMTRCDMDAVRAWPNSFDTRKACYGKLGIADTLSEMVMRPYAVFDNKGIRDAEIAKTSAWLTGNKTLLTHTTTAMTFVNNKFMQVVSQPETDIEAIKEYLELLHPEVEEWKSYTAFAESVANLHDAIYKLDLNRQLNQEAQILQDAKQKLAEYQGHYDLVYYLSQKGKQNLGELVVFHGMLRDYEEIINNHKHEIKQLETAEKHLSSILRQIQQNLPADTRYVMVDPDYTVTDEFIAAMNAIQIDCYITNQVPVTVVCP